MTDTHSTNSPIRPAQQSDEAEIMHLLSIMHAESGWRNMDVECCRHVVGLAWESDPKKRQGHLVVIGTPGHIRAMLYLLFTHAWYTRDLHIEELFCWVHPDHRTSDYSKLLIEYSKKCADDISKGTGKKVPLLMGVLTNKRMAGKVRLYRRFFGIPAGAFFLYNSTWVCNEPAEEDFWRFPAAAKWLRRRSVKDERRQANGAHS